MRRLSIMLMSLFLAGVVASPGARADAAPTPDWKQLRYDETHAGFNPAEQTIDRANVATLTRRWAKGPGVVNPLVQGGKVITCGSAICTSRYLTNGAKVWQSGPRTHATFDTIGGGRLYTVFSMILHVATYDLATGAPVAGGFGRPGGVSVVTYHAGRAFITASHGHVVAYDTDGNEQWSSEKDWALSDFYATPPTVAYNNVYVGGCKYMYALREDNGHVRWTAPIVGNVLPYCSGWPVVSDRKVFTANGSITAYDADTGAMLWTVAGDGGFLNSPAVAYDTVYVISAQAHTLSAYSTADGTKRWSVATGGTYSPTVANGLVYVATADGLEVFDAVDGTAITTVSGSYHGEAVISGGSVVVDCDDPVVGPGVCVLQPTS